MRIALLLCLALAGCQAGPGPAAERPNLVLIVADDLGYGDLGCYGSAAIRTPVLDRLAAEGVRLTSFYVSAPVCTPSRSSLLTGRYPYRNGLYEMIRNDLVNYGHRYSEAEYAVSPEMTLGMDLREATIGDALRAAGYRNGVVGKWDGGQARRYLPLQRGFDFFYGFANTGIDYWTHERYGVPSMFRGNERIKEEGYATDLFAREAVRFIRENRDRPFFLYAPFNAPHIASNLEKVPYQAPDELVGLYSAERPAPREAVYRAMVASLDAAVGRILDTLRELGLDGKTCVVFTSDNGGSGKASSNGVLRGGKSELFEGGVRVPFLARWPGRLPAGRTVDAFCSTLDLFPTLLAWAGAAPPPGVTLDGADMRAALAGGPSPRRELFWEWRGRRAARVGDWKWVESPRGGGLFDLSNDPGETTDLGAAQPARAAELRAAWAAWKKAMEATEPRGPFRDF